MLKEKRMRRVSTGGGIQLCLLLNSNSWEGGCCKFQTFCCFHPYQGKGSNWTSIFVEMG